ncbi:uncharacterized protein LOC119648612 [Hermetia illucens]|uniref:uncharacterized protein LOC119648612 n=1 Tax=Hermetia illucens TaxID=343691 RepID=UPI0018CC353C|nr:uncharacterized protein LOC119648612 [Hermetia illucens]
MLQATVTLKLTIQTLTLLVVVATMGGYRSRADESVDGDRPVTERSHSTDSIALASSYEILFSETGKPPSSDDALNIIHSDTHRTKLTEETAVSLTTPTTISTLSRATTTSTMPSTSRTTIVVSTIAASLKLQATAFPSAPTTVRTYLGMQSNVTSKNSKLKTETKFSLPKPQKTDAPMLNYIFDSFSTANKHHHHDQRYGPHFEDAVTDGNVTNITVQAGSMIFLNCRISLLQDKTVSWVKRKGSGANPLQLLTVGMHTYSGDSRFTIDFQYPNNWRLKIGQAKKSDEGIYECQISTHPPRVIQINLHVNAPEVMIVDEYGTALQEKYYEIDSTLQLSCIVRNVVMSSSVVYWSHGDQILNYDTTRGGVSVKTELMEDGANSTLFIAKINKSDSGNYTCSINSSHEYNIMVHILNGESFAELHHGSSSRVITHTSPVVLSVLLLPLAALQYRSSFIFNCIR